MICPNCDRRIEENATICQYCGKPLPEKEEEKPEELEQVLEEQPKPLLGFCGAVLGAAVSCALITLLPKLGLASSFGGVVIGFLVFIGYRLLSKHMTKIGFGVCIMFTLMTPYVAHQINGAMWLAANVKEISGIPLQELSFYQKFLLVPTAIAEDAINVIEYFMELFKLYIFTLVGAVAYIGGMLNARRKKKAQEKK